MRSPMQKLLVLKKRSKHNKKIPNCVKIVKLPIKKLLVFFFAPKGLSGPYQIRHSLFELIWYGPDNPCLAKKILIINISISWRDQITFQWDDNVHIVLDQHA